MKALFDKKQRTAKPGPPDLTAMLWLNLMNARGGFTALK